MERPADRRGLFLKAPVLAAVLAAALVLAGCSPAGSGDRPDGGPSQVTWMRTPVVTEVSAAGEVLVVRGRADPRARVLLRAEDGAAFATSADGQGRFEIRVQPSPGVMLLRPQVQAGPDTAAAPERLLLVGGVGGAAALVTPGEPVRRLDRRQILEAVDSDGQIVVVSGAATAGAMVAAGLNDQPRQEAMAGEDGRWSARLGPPPAGAATVTADGAPFAYPGPDRSEMTDSAVGRGAAATGGRAGEGWRIVLTDPAAAPRDIWLPDAR